MISISLIFVIYLCLQWYPMSVFAKSKSKPSANPTTETKTTSKASKSSKASPSQTLSAITEKGKYLYYIPDGEGLVSQVRRADLVWNIANSVNRLVRMVSFNTGHFGFKEESLCEIFDMPSNFSCISETKEEIFEKTHCIIASTSKPASYYKGYPIDTECSTTFDYSKVDCVAGAFFTTAGKYPQYDRIPILMNTKVINENYLKFLPQLRKLLGVGKNVEYSVVHWRRDDQLKTRCFKNIDTSVNCRTPEELAATVNKLGYKNYNRTKTTITYIATDEKRVEQLDYLKSQKYKLFESDLSEGMQNFVDSSSNIKRDIFVLELMMMMDADYYMAWGYSSVHKFVCEYRLLTSDKKVVISNNVRVREAVCCDNALE